MASVARSECRPPRGNDAGDFDVAEVDGLPNRPALRRATCRFVGRHAIEREYSSLEIIIEDATERVLELTSAASVREQLQTEADLEDGHCCSPD